MERSTSQREAGGRRVQVARRRVQAVSVWGLLTGFGVRGL